MKRFPVALVIAAFCASLSSGCAENPELDRLTAGGPLAYLPANASGIVVLPSHELAMKHLFTLLAHFFGNDAVKEMRDKLFGNLKNETGLDLLDSASLRQNGFRADEPLVLASTPERGVYAAIPLADPLAAAAFLGKAGLAIDRSVNPWRGNVNGFTCLVARDRLYLFARQALPGPKQAVIGKELLVALEKSDKTLLAVALVDNAMLASGPLPLAALPGRTLIRLERTGDTLGASLTRTGVFLDPVGVLRSLLPAGMPLAPGWAGAGYGCAGFTAESDLLSCETVVDFGTLWNNTLRPLLADRIRRGTRGMDNALTRILTGGKALEEKIIGALDIENAVLGRLTGRVGFILRGLRDFSPLALSPRRLAASIDGVVAVEALNAAAAAAIINHVAEFSALPTGNQFSISQSNVGGTKTVIFSAPRYGMPDVYVAAGGRFVCVGLSARSVAGIAAQGEARGNAIRLYGPDAAASLTKSAHDFSLRLSVAGMYAAITTTLDPGTQRNLAPFADQILKAGTVSVVQFREADGTSRLVLHSRLSGETKERDPFGEGTSETDWTLLVLGLILGGVFVLPLVFALIRRFRHR